MQRHADFNLIARRYGIHLPQAMDYIPDHLAQDAAMALDAMPALVTVSNSGIPAFLTSFIDPGLIEILTTPNKFAQIIGEQKKGDWTTSTALFPVAESVGEVSSYGDYSPNGAIKGNVNWPQRQSYHYQTVTEWGERELEMMGVGRIDWANRLNRSSATIMDKFQNKSYALGIAGLQSYGLLNDPSLTAPVAPGAKVAGGFTWPAGDALEILKDITTLVQGLISQSGGNIEMTDPLKLCMSPIRATQMTKTTIYNVNVLDMLKKNYPNLTVETAVEYTTVSGELVQIIAPMVGGQSSMHCAFTEKMRAHPVKVDLSSFQQKKSAGTWGTVITQPFAIYQMIGI